MGTARHHPPAFPIAIIQYQYITFEDANTKQDGISPSVYGALGTRMHNYVYGPQAETVQDDSR